MKFNIEDTLKVVQLRQELIPELARVNLQNWADFKDSDKDIDECMVSLGTVEGLLEKARNGETKEFYEGLIDAMNEADASYVQILKI